MAGKKPRRGILNRLTRGANLLFRTLTGRGGFTPDRVTVAPNKATSRAQHTETALIRIATEEALVPLPNRGRAIRRIRQQTAYGLGQITAAAEKHATEAEELGTVLGHNMVTPDPSEGDPETDLGAPEPHDDGSRLTRAQALRLADTAIRPPRNTDTGNTPNIPRSMRETIGDLAPTVTKSATDLFDGIAAEIKRNPPTSDTDRRRTAQRVLDDFHKRGITGMVDKAGRRWNLTTYVEMATRTAATELARRAQVAEVLRAGMDIVRVTVMPNCNPLCQPFQGRLLSLTGKATHDALGEPVVTTLKDALSRGYNHPNAVLGGDQEIDTLAGAVGASKGTYRGPAITVRTARGNHVTVSPHHPVLTPRGWVIAQSLREGDKVFSPAGCQPGTVRRLTHPDVDKVKASVEDAFTALEVVGTRTSGPATGDHFDDDRQFLYGEVHVVTTDGCLLPVPDPQVIKETGQVRFVWPDTDTQTLTGSSPECISFRGRRVSVFRPLTNGDAPSVEATPQGAIRNAEQGGEFLAVSPGSVEGDEFVIVDDLPHPEFDTCRHKGTADGRVGDSQNPGTVALAVPGGIEFDEVIAVNVVEFSGHAYDFQTVDGVYSVGGIILHNCRHTIVPHVPGSAPRAGDTIDPGDYKAVQKLRSLEVEVRKAKTEQATALTDEARAKAGKRVRAAQKLIREHVAETGVVRVPLREQIDRAR